MADRKLDRFEVMGSNPIVPTSKMWYTDYLMTVYLLVKGRKVFHNDGPMDEEEYTTTELDPVEITFSESKAKAWNEQDKTMYGFKAFEVTGEPDQV